MLRILRNNVLQKSILIPRSAVLVFKPIAAEEVPFNIQKCSYHLSNRLNWFWDSKQSVPTSIEEKTYSFTNEKSDSKNNTTLDQQDLTIQNITSANEITNNGESASDLADSSLTFGDSAKILDDSSGILGDSAEVLSDSASSFADLGLGGSILPHHLFQDLLNYLHTTVGFEWCSAIVILTIALRTLGLPSYILMRKFSVRVSNAHPEIHKLQQKIMKAQSERNTVEMNKARIEYMNFMGKENVNPLKGLLYQAPNAIIFGSMFMGLRGMCSAHLPSMVNGGHLWFTDLTIADPYMILPLFSCLSMAAIIHLGAADAEMGAASQIGWVKKFMIGTIFLSLPIMIFQPSAMFIFWLTSNLISAFLATAFKRQPVKKLFEIPEMIKRDPKQMEELAKAANPFENFKKMKRQQAEAKRALEKFNQYKKAVEQLKKDQEKIQK